MGGIPISELDPDNSISGLENIPISKSNRITTGQFASWVNANQPMSINELYSYNYTIVKNNGTLTTDPKATFTYVQTYLALNRASVISDGLYVDAERRISYNVMDYNVLGAPMGDGVERLLSSYYGTLAAAQVDYPHVTRLTETVDWAAIQAANLAATPLGGTVRFPPGTYVVSNIILVDYLNTLIQESLLAPSFIGGDGLSGPSPDFVTTHKGAVVLICGSTFPTGEYVIDILGPKFTGVVGANNRVDKTIAGGTVAGFVINCNGKGAGVRFVDVFATLLRNVQIGGTPATPNPANTGAYSSNPNNNVGAVNFSAVVSTQNFNNHIENVYVQAAPLVGFQISSGIGSLEFMTNCIANNCGSSGYKVEYKCTLVACHAQSNCRTTGTNGADFQLSTYEVTLIGCNAYAGKPVYGNGIKITGGDNANIKIIGGTYYGCSGAGLADNVSAVIQLNPNAQPHNVQFIGVDILTGSASKASCWLYMPASARGQISFTNCNFDDSASPLLVSPFLLNGVEDLVSFLNCAGINPKKVKRWGNIANGVQTLEEGVTGGAVSGGTCTLTVLGNTTTALAFDASAAVVRAAIEALASVGAGNVTVTGNNLNSGRLFVTFIGALANTSIALITANSSGLTGGAAPTLTVVRLVPGGASPALTRVDGDYQYFNATTNLTPSVTNGLIIGDTMTWEITQDATGSRTIVPSGTNVKFAGGSSSTSGANKTDIYVFGWGGTYWREISRSLNIA